MNCIKCGYLIKEGEKSCKVCGHIVGDPLPTTLSPVDDILLLKEAKNGGQVKDNNVNNVNKVITTSSVKVDDKDLFSYDKDLNEEPDNFEKVEKQASVKETPTNLSIEDLKKAVLNKNEEKDKTYNEINKISGSEIISIVIGLLGLVLAFFTKGLSVVLTITAIILGVKQYKKTRQNSIGLLIGIIGTIVAIVFLSLTIIELISSKLPRTYVFERFKISTNFVWRNIKNSQQAKFINKDGKTVLIHDSTLKLKTNNYNFDLRIPKNKEIIYNKIYKSYDKKYSNEKIVNNHDTFKLINDQKPNLFIAYYDTNYKVSTNNKTINNRYYFLADNEAHLVLVFKLSTYQKLESLDNEVIKLLETVEVISPEKSLGEA